MSQQHADNAALVQKVAENAERLRVLENRVRMTEQTTQTKSQGELGAGTAQIIDLGSQLFMKPSLTGSDGANSVGILDCVFYEPTEAFPFGGVGPTGADSGFKSRGAGV